MIEGSAIAVLTTRTCVCSLIFSVVGANIDLANQDFSLVEAAYETLEKAEPLKCTYADKIYPAVPSPKVIIIDVSPIYI